MSGIKGCIRKPKAAALGCNRKLLHRFGPLIKYRFEGLVMPSGSKPLGVKCESQTLRRAHSSRCRHRVSAHHLCRNISPSPTLWDFSLDGLTALGKKSRKAAAETFPGASAAVPGTSSSAGSFSIPNRPSPRATPSSAFVPR